MEKFQQSGHNALGVVCKTQKHANDLYEALKDDFPKMALLSNESAAFSSGIVVTTVHMAKGLEFDQVLVPHTDAKNYQEPMDRSLLYVACTRAMHHLYLTHVGSLSPFLNHSEVLV